MNIEKKLETLFGMTEEVWQRHTNPISVWSRYCSVPILFLAIWSRVWFGWWALVFILLAIFFTWWNPRMFPAPKSTKHWPSMAVLGERVFLKEQYRLPPHHSDMILFIKYVMFVGLLLVGTGLILLDKQLTILGTLILLIGKSWFLDRMVWLYLELKDQNDEYRSWLY